MVRARVHGEATDGSNDVLFIVSQPAGSERRNSVLFIGRQQTWSECVLFNGSQPAWTEPLKRGLAYRSMEETAFCSTGYGRNGGPDRREGCGVPQNGGNGLVLERYGRNGVLFIRRGVAYRKTGLHGILFISTVDPLQPPRGTVHPPSTSSSLHLRLFIQPPPATI